MFDLTRNPRIPHLQEKDMPASWTCCIANSLSSGKKEDCDSSARLLKVPRVHQDNMSSRTSKKVQNQKANCFALLRRITTLKCASSEVKWVHIHFKKGSLKWVHGTMSEPPWKSH